MTTTLAAATAQQDTGWGRLIALVAAAGLFWLATSAHKRWKEIKDLPSPDHGPKALPTVKAQVNADSDSENGPSFGGGEVVPLRRRPVDQFVADRAGKQPATAIVREAAEELKVSEASAWRAWRRFRRGAA